MAASLKRGGGDLVSIMGAQWIPRSERQLSERRLGRASEWKIPRLSPFFPQFSHRCSGYPVLVYDLRSTGCGARDLSTRDAASACTGLDGKPAWKLIGLLFKICDKRVCFNNTPIAFQLYICRIEQLFVQAEAVEK